MLYQSGCSVGNYTDVALIALFNIVGYGSLAMYPQAPRSFQHTVECMQLGMAPGNEAIQGGLVFSMYMYCS